MLRAYIPVALAEATAILLQTSLLLHRPLRCVGNPDINTVSQGRVRLAMPPQSIQTYCA